MSQLDLASLDYIRDHNLKFLLTIDHGFIASHNGINQIYVFKWLAEQVLQ